jgi:hypothetical protein
MAVGGDIAVNEESVAGGKADGECVSVGSDAYVLDFRSFSFGLVSGPAMQSETSQRGITIHAREVAEYFIERPVFADHEDQVF